MPNWPDDVASLSISELSKLASEVAFYADCILARRAAVVATEEAAVRSQFTVDAEAVHDELLCRADVAGRAAAARGQLAADAGMERARLAPPAQRLSAAAIAGLAAPPPPPDARGTRRWMARLLCCPALLRQSRADPTRPPADPAWTINVHWKVGNLLRGVPRWKTDQARALAAYVGSANPNWRCGDAQLLYQALAEELAAGVAADAAADIAADVALWGRGARRRPGAAGGLLRGIAAGLCLLRTLCVACRYLDEYYVKNDSRLPLAAHLSAALFAVYDRAGAAEQLLRAEPAPLSAAVRACAAACAARGWREPRLRLPRDVMLRMVEFAPPPAWLDGVAHSAARARGRAPFRAAPSRTLDVIAGSAAAAASLRATPPPWVDRLYPCVRDA